MPVGITISMTVQGFWSWIEANPGAVAFTRIRAIYRAAQRQAFSEFMQNTLPKSKGIASRFSESYAGKVTPRDPKYMQRVRKYFGGRYLPFVSPSLYGMEKHKPEGGYFGHLMNNIKKVGSGYRVALKNNTGDTVVTSMTMPAAKVLNWHPQYRAEFLDLASRNKDDAAAIENRVHEIALPTLHKEIARATKRQLRKR